jgi:Tol biopolymer transport system component
MKRILFMLIMTAAALAVRSQKNEADTNYTTRISSTAWMPDGENVLLGIVKHHKTDRRSPFFSKVFLYNIQGGSLTFLFDDGSSITSSPDGKSIAFLKRSENIRTAIHFYNIDTKKETSLKPDTSGKYGLAWSPDGKNLAYNITQKQAGSSATDIFILNLADKQVKQITQSGMHKSYDPQWSPDSKRIVYYFEKGDGHDQIWLTDVNGSFHRNLTSDTSTHNYFPSWIDDKTIIYTQSPEELMMMSADGSKREKIEGVNATPVKYNAKANKLIYIKSEEENKLMLFDWKLKTARELLDGTKLAALF